MMILGAEIGLLVLGIYGLTTGKLTLSKTRVVEGPAARWLAVVCMLPLPLSFVVGFVIGFTTAARGQPWNPDSWRWTLILIEGGIVVACVAVVYTVGWGLAEHPEQRPGRRRMPEPG